MAEEQLILVDESNRATGSAGKTAVHRAGLLHRAFSIFIVDDRGRIVLQQRSPKKYHSGGLWANSCCGHPRPGERTIAAARRRLGEELGVTSAAVVRFFRALPDRARQRHARERVRLRLFRAAARPSPAPTRPRSPTSRMLSCDDISRRIERDPDAFAFWFKHYFRSHGADIARLAREASRRPSI